MKISTSSRIKIYNSPQQFIFSIYTFSTTAHVICFSRVDAQKDGTSGTVTAGIAHRALNIY